MNNTGEVYLWQRAGWQAFLAADENSRLGHALLVTGAPGVGLDWFAACQCRYLLDLPSDGRNIKEIAHPDLMWVRREHPGPGNNLTKPRAKILTGQIRNLAEYLHQRPTGSRKVAVLELAEDCNEHAANALLKPLEEPAFDSHVILLSHAPSRLSATIRSRCTKIEAGLSTFAEAEAWLDDTETELHRRLALWLTGGAPVRAAQILANREIEELIDLDKQLAAMLDKSEFSWTLVEGFASHAPVLVNDFLLRVLLTASGLQDMAEVASVAVLRKWPARMPGILLEDCLVKRRLIYESSTLNHELLLAHQFVYWLETLKKSAKAG